MHKGVQSFFYTYLLTSYYILKAHDRKAYSPPTAVNPVLFLFALIGTWRVITAHLNIAHPGFIGYTC
jgi:hypothetical protein